MRGRGRLLAAAAAMTIAGTADAAVETLREGLAKTYAANPTAASKPPRIKSLRSFKS